MRSYFTQQGQPAPFSQSFLQQEPQIQVHPLPNPIASMVPNADLQPLLQALAVRQTLPLENPFAWRSVSYLTTREIKFFPEGSNPTISFTATRNSKILGYLPLIGSIIGISRIYKGIQEYRLFTSTHLHSLSDRSILWITRGVLESIPVLGGVACIVIDIAATILSRNDNLEDFTACGFCHRCGFCKC